MLKQFYSFKVGFEAIPILVRFKRSEIIYNKIKSFILPILLDEK